MVLYFKTRKALISGYIGIPLNLNEPLDRNFSKFYHDEFYFIPLKTSARPERTFFNFYIFPNYQ